MQPFCGAYHLLYGAARANIQDFQVHISSNYYP